MTTAQATRHHVLKMGLTEDLCGQANKAMNPPPSAVDYLRKKWIKNEHGGLNDLSMFESIRKYANENPQLTLKVQHDDDKYSVVLVTPLMKRVHQEFREASEVVFVDATGCVDQLHTSLVLMLCAGPGGAAPLAVLLTSSQDENSLTKGKIILYSYLCCIENSFQ